MKPRQAIIGAMLWANWSRLMKMLFSCVAKSLTGSRILASTLKTNRPFKTNGIAAMAIWMTQIVS